MVRWLFAILMAMFLLSFNSNAQWEKANGAKTLPDATAILAVITNGSTIIAATSAGIYISTNNGDNWTQKNNGLQNPSGFSELCTKGNLIFAGNMEAVFVTSDNGDTWIEKDDGLNGESIYCLLVVGNNVFAGTSGGIFMSSNNGNNWVQKNQGIPEFETVNSLNLKNNIIFAGTSVGVYASTNNGDSWGNKNFDNEVFSITSNKDCIMLCEEGFNKGVYVSTNNGMNWVSKSNGLTLDRDLHYFLISIGDSVFAGGTNTGVYLSANDGNTWTPYNDGLSAYVQGNELMFASNNNYIFVGSKGSNGFCNLWRRLLNELPISVEEKYTVPGILQVFPNPVTENLNLTIDLPNDDYISLTLDDVLGNSTVIANHELKYKGSNNISIPVSNLSAGTYFVRLMTSGSTITITVVIYR